MGSFIQVGKYFNSNILYTCEAFCLWLYFFQSKLQFRNKFFCTLAKNPLSPLETNSSFFSFSITFGEIYKAIEFSPAVFFLVVTLLFFLILQTYIPNFYMWGGYQVLRKQKCRVTQNPLSTLPDPVLRAWPSALQSARDHSDHPSAPHSPLQAKPPRFPTTPCSLSTTVTQLPSHGAPGTPEPTSLLLPQSSLSHLFLLW